ncbi:MAG: CHAP domain-containing protein [Pseudomonadota bacterium]
MLKYLIVLSVFLVSGCATPTQKASGVLPAPNLKPNSFYRVDVTQQCVPYARQMSGIQIRGDAHTWWKQAKGLYDRGQTPRKGAVIVLSKTDRLKHGHLAVVSDVIDSRTIEVAHSNWGGDKYTRSYVYEFMPVRDISKNNDWSKVKFWNYPSSSFGRVYPVSGFIYPKQDQSIMSLISENLF